MLANDWVPVAILLDGATDDDDEQHSQEEGEQNTQNDLLISGQQPVHYRERERRQRWQHYTKTTQTGLYRIYGLDFLIKRNTEMNINTCSSDMLWVLRVCVLAIDVSGSEPKPDKYGTVQCQHYIIIKHVTHKNVEVVLCVCVCGALTHRPFLASEVHCRNYQCCSPLHSHRSLRSHT